MAAVLTTFQPHLAPAFASLNYEWIEHFFTVEAEDRKALDDPQAYALDKGGEIFFVLENDDPVGTVAMVPLDGQPGVLELAKMAVRPDRQGRGYSKLLMQACIDFAKAKGAREIMLVSNDCLAPALGLYLSSGFVAVPVVADERYARCNLQMRLELEARPARQD